MIVSIEDLIEERISGEWGEKADEESGVFVLRTTNFKSNGQIDFTDVVKRNIPPSKIEKKQLKVGDIIIEKSGGSPTQPVGRVVFFDYDSKDVFLTNNFTAILRPTEGKVFPKYLFYKLQEAYRTGLVKRHQNKTTGIINLRLDSYLSEKIEIAGSYRDQIKIAVILGKVENLIRERIESIDMLDRLSKSIFWEIHSNNEKRLYPLDQLKSGGSESFSNGPFGSDLLSSELTDSGIPVIYIRDISDGRFDWKSGVYVTTEKAESLKNCHVKPGDLLISKVGTPPGVAATYPMKNELAIITQDVIRLRVNKEVANSNYLHYLLNSEYGRFSLRKITIQGTRARFSLGELKKLEIELPSLEVQDEFSFVVRKIERLKEYYENSLNELKNLLGSISQKAFGGEIDLENLSIDHIIPRSEGGSDDFANLDVLTKEDNVRKADKSPEEWEASKSTPIEVTPEQQSKDLVEHFGWKSIPLKQLSNWLKEDFGDRYFNSEMLIKYLLEEKAVIISKDQPLYYSSEEVKKNRKLDPEQDLKKIIFDALEKQDNPFLKLEQVFYDAEKENFHLRLRPKDYNLIKNKSPKERSGIYLKLKQ